MTTLSITSNIFAVRSPLLHVGFRPEGALLVLRLPVSQMPYAMEHIVPSAELSEQAIAAVTVDASNQLKLSITPDYSEEWVPLVSEDSFGILRDAGVFGKMQAVME